jgi:hypothetical protein
MSFLSYKIVSKEYLLKRQIGYPFDSQDIQKMDLSSFATILGAGKKK